MLRFMLLHFVKFSIVKFTRPQSIKISFTQNQFLKFSDFVIYFLDQLIRKLNFRLLYFSVIHKAIKL